jgi:ankyrin repeat protein
MTFSLSDFPNEIILAIAKELHSESAINALARTSRHFYSLLNPFLYRYHAADPKMPALRWAAKQGYANTLINLLDAGVDLFAPSLLCTDQKRHTLNHHPLLSAIQYGHLHIVEIFLDRGGMSKRLKEKDYDLPLIFALSYTQIDILQFLLQRGLNFWDTAKFETTLAYAVGGGSPEVFELLLRDAEHRHLLDPARKLPVLGHALWLAANQGHDELVQFLLAEGADVNFREDGASHATPLDSAVLNSHYSIAELLLQAGADPKMVDCDDIGPLSRATRPSEYIWPQTGGFYRRDDKMLVPPYPQDLRDELVAMTRLLLDYGADVAGPDGATALRVAMHSKNSELTNLLLMHGARVLRIHRSVHARSDRDTNDYWV